MTRRFHTILLALAATVSLASGASATTFPGHNGKIAVATFLEGSACHKIGLATSQQRVRLLTNPCPGGFMNSDGEPTFSPNGKLIVFVRDQFGETELRLVRANGSGERHLLGGSSSGNLRNPMFLRGGRIALVGPWNLGGNPTNNNDTFVKRIGKDGFRRVSSLEASDYAPDGRKFVAVKKGDLYLVNHRTGKSFRRLTRNELVEKQPSFSPNGSWIVFARKQASDRPGHVDLMLTRTDGSRLRRLVSVADGNPSPIFSPDGRWLAYCEDRHGGPRDVYAVSITQPTKERVITNLPGESKACDPSWQRIRP